MQKNPTSFLALQPLTGGVAMFTFSFCSTGGVIAMAVAWTGETWRVAADRQGPRCKMKPFSWGKPFFMTLPEQQVIYLLPLPPSSHAACGAGTAVLPLGAPWRASRWVWMKDVFEIFSSYTIYMCDNLWIYRIHIHGCVYIYVYIYAYVTMIYNYIIIHIVWSQLDPLLCLHLIISSQFIICYPRYHHGISNILTCPTLNARTFHQPTMFGNLGEAS